MQIPFIVFDGEDGWLVGECPMLPGCITQGRTVEEIRFNLQEAAEGWLEVTFEKIVKEAAKRGETIEWIEPKPGTPARTPPPGAA